MKKILFLPLLRMQSGHHQVAEALMDMLSLEEFIVKKIDLLSYTNGMLEEIVTKGYLKWIRYAPETYDFVYKNFFFKQTKKDHSFKWFQHIFLKKMEELILEENPDLIVCTHGFPSYLLSKLKTTGKCNIPVINVYTDFFINNFWGNEGIDIHFLPSKESKNQLSAKIPEQKMIVTGIPVHREIKSKSYRFNNDGKPRILIAGGNSGLGDILGLADELKQSTNCEYFILCGNNKNLYNAINAWGAEHIKAIPYITSRVEMDKIYNEVDAIVTKPGGVTISEAIRKDLPIFVHAALPGQEEINLRYLKEQNLAFEIEHKQHFETQVISILNNEQKMLRWENAVESFKKGIEMESPERIVVLIKWMIDQQARKTASNQIKQVLHVAGA